MFLVPLVVFLGVKFGFRKSSLCKRNDKYKVWLGTPTRPDDDAGGDCDQSLKFITL